jgi:enoyl-CoA hydratase/carnithine racemase
MPSAEALDMGLVDELAPSGSVPEAARQWCEHTISSPSTALSNTRAKLRRDLKELLAVHRDRDIEELSEVWFEPELQRTLKALVASLKGK